MDLVIVIAMNDAWVMSAWGKANGIKDDSIVGLTAARYGSRAYGEADVYVGFWYCFFKKYRLDERL